MLPLQQQDVVWDWHVILWWLRFNNPFVRWNFALIHNFPGSICSMLCPIKWLSVELLCRRLVARTCGGWEWSFSGASSSCCCSVCPAGVCLLMPRRSSYVWVRTLRWPGNWQHLTCCNSITLHYRKRGHVWTVIGENLRHNPLHFNAQPSLH